MSDGLPTEDQLRRMEQRVMARIRRRAEMPKRIAAGAATTALVVGGVLLLPQLGLTGGGGSTAGGASGGGSMALVAHCHVSSAATSEYRSAPVEDARTTGAGAIEACLTAIRTGRVEPEAADSSGGTSSLRDELRTTDLVACRDRNKVLQVFVQDDRPSTLCRRNGMTPAP